MDDFADEPEMTGPRRPYRPPVGIPTDDGGRWRGVAISLMFHLFIVALIIVPVVTADVRDMRERRAAGAGPSGGGGGGRGGTGGVEERIFYLRLAPGQAPSFTAPPAEVTAPPPPVPVVAPPPPPPDEPVPRPVPPPPPAVPQTAAPVSPADRDTAVASRGAPATAPIPGTGGGTGNDGSVGSGSGRGGGGVGTGVGTGRGSGVGPGTGGAGVDSIYPPTLLTLALPPLQPPAKVRPYTLVALFDVDERGTTRLIGFNQTSDSRFNRQMRSVLAEVKFRPATRRDGTAVRDTGRFVIEYP